jgi:hypothetical protein
MRAHCVYASNARSSNVARMKVLKIVPKVALALTLALAIASYFALQVDRAGSATFFGILLGSHVLVLLYSLYWGHKDERLGEWLRPRQGDLALGIAGGGLMFLALWALTHFGFAVGTARESFTARFYLQLGLPAALRAQTVQITAGLALLAVCEEVFFRGLWYAQIEAQIGTRRAWLGGTLAQVGMTLPTLVALRDPVAGLNPFLVLWALLTAAVNTVLAVKKESLVAGIVARFFSLWLVVMLFRLWGPGL